MPRATAVPPSHDRPADDPDRSVACFSIAAHSDPGVLPRVIELFAKRGLVPTRCHAARAGDTGESLAIEVEMAGMDADGADYVARCLRQIHRVDCVLTSRRPAT